MDDLTLLKSFRAECAGEDQAARAEIRRALESRFDAPPAPVASPIRRRGFTARHRRVLAFAAVTAVAVAVAGSLVLDSGPTAQPAAAEILRETAAIASAQDARITSPLPGPGQLLYTKVRRVELTGWISGCDPLDDRGCFLSGGTMSGSDAFNALIPTTQEEWRGEDGIGRMRWVAGTPQFWSEQEQSRWKAAGSIPPPPFDPEYQRMVAQLRSEEPIPPGHETKTREENQRIIDTETVVDLDQMKGQPFRFPDTSRLPTEPEALRRAVESNQISHRGFNLANLSAKQLDSEETTAELLNILSEGSPMTPPLRAAIFNALAEMPGINVEADAIDSLGREGFAIRSIEEKSGSGIEYIFDPDTAEILARRTFLGEHDTSPYLKDVPAGTTISETVYLETAIVDSTDETAAEVETEEPVAHIGLDRK
jgi:hypothetical protein